MSVAKKGNWGGGKARDCSRLAGRAPDRYCHLVSARLPLSHPRRRLMAWEQAWASEGSIGNYPDAAPHIPAQSIAEAQTPILRAAPLYRRAYRSRRRRSPVRLRPWASISAPDDGDGYNRRNSPNLPRPTRRGQDRRRPGYARRKTLPVNCRAPDIGEPSEWPRSTRGTRQGTTSSKRRRQGLR